MSATSTRSVREIAEAAKQASRVLAPLDGARRNAVLEAIAQGLEAARDELFAANAEDLRIAETMSGDEKLSPATLSRLKLNDAKLREMVEQVRSVAALPDPLGRTLDAIELDDADPATNLGAPSSPPASSAAKVGPHAVLTETTTGSSSGLQAAESDAPPAGALARQVETAIGLHLQKISVPLGVLAVIFEARPDAVTQISALALKSGNAAILKPGREVEHTAEALLRVLRKALAQQGLPEDALTLVLGRERAAELLTLHGLVDMVIPRGSKQLVEYVQANTRIPVLGHAEGVCHIYVDRSADQQLALRVIEDAKLDYPAACNAVETVLVHRDIAPQFLPALGALLTSRNVLVHGDDATRSTLTAEAILPVDDWHTEYGDLALSLGVVGSLDEAIDHIHQHGSSHTESIIAQDPQAAERFLREVDAAGVFHNASTRFADGFRYGFGAEVGISTSKFHARGPVGLEGLTTYKYVLRGHGHIAGDYRGPNARAFTHRREGSGS